MPYSTCRHVRETGYLCQSPALRDHDYCYYHTSHRARRMRIAQARAGGAPYWLDLPPLEDMRAVQSAIERVVEALSADLIEPKRAQLILAGLRIASMNLRAVNAWGLFSQYANDGYLESVSSYPVAQQHGLAADVDLDADPQTAFAAADPRAAFATAAAPSSDQRNGKHPVKHPAKRVQLHQVKQRRHAAAIETVPGMIDIYADDENPVEAARTFARAAMGASPLDGPADPSARKQPDSVSAAGAASTDHKVSGS